VSKTPENPQDDSSDEIELMRSEFDSIIEGLSLDESSPSSFLEDLERIDEADRFIAPIVPRQSLRSTFFSAKNAITRWFNRGGHDDDGAHI
jgi:hypothetical protein